MYHSYWYRSGVNQTMTLNLHEIARQAVERSPHELQRRMNVGPSCEPPTPTICVR